MQIWSLYLFHLFTTTFGKMWCIRPSSSSNSIQLSYTVKSNEKKFFTTTTVLKLIYFVCVFWRENSICWEYNSWFVKEVLTFSCIQVISSSFKSDEIRYDMQSHSLIIEIGFPWQPCEQKINKLSSQSLSSCLDNTCSFNSYISFFQTLHIE